MAFSSQQWFHLRIERIEAQRQRQRQRLDQQGTRDRLVTACSKILAPTGSLP
jgi:hypothetical protein